MDWLEREHICMLYIYIYIYIHIHIYINMYIIYTYIYFFSIQRIKLHFIKLIVFNLGYHFSNPNLFGDICLLQFPLIVFISWISPFKVILKLILKEASRNYTCLLSDTAWWWIEYSEWGKVRNRVVDHNVQSMSFILRYTQTHTIHTMFCFC